MRSAGSKSDSFYMFASYLFSADGAGGRRGLTTLRWTLGGVRRLALQPALHAGGGAAPFWSGGIWQARTALAPASSARRRTRFLPMIRGMAGFGAADFTIPNFARELRVLARSPTVHARALCRHATCDHPTTLRFARCIFAPHGNILFLSCFRWFAAQAWRQAVLLCLPISLLDGISYVKSPGDIYAVSFRAGSTWRRLRLVMQHALERIR
jgi:hypothetical protein